uniref:NADH dehydrogenase [ubiquinone] 1 beta subcomplex subunit 8, mitochondrial n=2 Tax=Chlamydomonas leiostraca TaxID=1034604 RepID=A0A7S0RTJ2_9CHLO|mmetsp:Transcript_31241/g.79662  ORF Transcript_31241/g.79662 Transcript_31241/m.79662 type:complete len:149 (+) Transcript_31241:45-491(+)
MALRQLRGLAANAMNAVAAAPQRGGAGAPIKIAPRPDKPLPLWYEMWWDNGVFPGQPACDYMFGPLPANLTEAWYAKAWAAFAVFMGVPIWYHYNHVDEFRHPFVPHQYPPETREVLLRSRNTSLVYDYSQPDYEELKKRRQRYYTSF